MSMPTPNLHLDRGPPRPQAPHVSPPAGWAMLLGFLSFTGLAIGLYLLRLSQAAT
jgi:hypothetical protein